MPQVIGPNLSLAHILQHMKHNNYKEHSRTYRRNKYRNRLIIADAVAFRVAGNNSMSHFQLCKNLNYQLVIMNCWRWRLYKKQKSSRMCQELVLESLKENVENLAGQNRQSKSSGFDSQRKIIHNSQLLVSVIHLLKIHDSTLQIDLVVVDFTCLDFQCSYQPHSYLDTRNHNLLVYACCYHSTCFGRWLIEVSLTKMKVRKHSSFLFLNYN
jgi:hypothetical protein